MTIAVSKLAAAQAAAKAAPAAPVESRLARAKATTPRGELVTLPLIGQVWIELAGEMVVDEIESAVFSAMKALDLPPTPLNARTYDSRRTALTLAWAVRDATDRASPFDSADNWCGMDIDFISACGIVYNDVRERLNPVAYPLTAEEFDEIRLQHEKKNPTMLRTYGVVTLSNYLATTDAPPASSPTPPPSPGQS